MSAENIEECRGLQASRRLCSPIAQHTLGHSLCFGLGLVFWLHIRFKWLNIRLLPWGLNMRSRFASTCLFLVSFGVETLDSVSFSLAAASTAELS